MKLRQKCRPVSRPGDRPFHAAFTLIEVMIAIVIFFMAMFTILGVLSSGLHAASLLRNNGPTAGMVASQLSLTNKLTEGGDSGDFGQLENYKDFRWTSQTVEITTNGLFRIDITVTDAGGNPQSTASILLYRPDSDSHLGLH